MRRTTIKLGIAFGVLAGLLSAGCVAPVFNDPVSVSTDSRIVEGAERIGPVAVEQCAYVFIIIPIPIDPRDAYDELLAKAQALGGNSVVDYQLRTTSYFQIPLIYARSCLEVTGIAARMEI